jgi:hypothetical protein
MAPASRHGDEHAAAPVLEHPAEGLEVAGHDGGAGGHGLDEHDAEGLAVGVRRAVDLAAGEHPRLVGLGDAAQQLHPSRSERAGRGTSSASPGPATSRCTSGTSGTSSGSASSRTTRPLRGSSMRPRNTTVGTSGRPAAGGPPRSGAPRRRWDEDGVDARCSTTTRRAAGETAMRPSASRARLQRGAEDLQGAASGRSPCGRSRPWARCREAGQHRHARHGRLVHVQDVELRPREASRRVRASDSGPKTSRATEPL